MLLAVVLSIVAIIGWFFLQSALYGSKNGKPTTPAKDGTENAAGMDGAPPAGMQAVPDPGMAGSPPAPPAPGNPPVPAPPAPAGPAPLVPDHPFQVAEGLERGEWFEVGFTDRGGAIRYVILRNSFERPEREEPDRKRLHVIDPVEPRALTGMIRLGKEDAEGLSTALWTRDEAREQATPETDVVFWIETKDGLRITKRWVLPNEPDRFDCDLELTATRTKDLREGEKAVVHLLGAAGMVKEPVAVDTPFMGPPKFVAEVLNKTDGVLQETYKIPEILPADPEDFRFIGMRSHYFAAVLWSDGKPQSHAFVKRVWGEGGDAHERDVLGAYERLEAFYAKEHGRTTWGDRQLKDRLQDAAKFFRRAWAQVDLPVADGTKPASPTVLHVYLGPVSRHPFAADRCAPLTGLIEYSMAPDWLARLLLWILDLWGSLTGSVGLAVILMTITVRGALMPLSVKNQLSLRAHGRKIQKIKPKLDALKKRYANDRKKFQEEQIKLYREHGIGFPMGCLMMLLQIPIFFALFSSLRAEFDLRHQAFLWMVDLSEPDRLVEFGMTINLFVISFGALNLLPLLMIGLSLYQQRLMPKPTDPQQAQQMKMMKWMPWVFAILLYNYTAALALYMVCSSIVAIFESKWVRHHDAIATAAAAAAT